jgi:hypothetical protein
MVERKINQLQAKKCHEFATKIITESNQYNRFNKSTDIQIIRTYVGKLAEVVFLEYLLELGVDAEEGDMFEIFAGAENADGFDFTLPNGQTIDIKTASLPFHSRIMVPITQFHLKKDYYVGIKLYFTTLNIQEILEFKIDKAVIFGYATRQEFEQMPTANYGEGNCKAISLNALHPISELIKKFRD